MAALSKQEYIKKDDKKKKKICFRPDRKFFVRLLAGLLCLLMILSAAALTIQLFTVSSYAADTGYYYTGDGSDVLIAVGLMYADGVTVGFETRAANGFSAGAVNNARHFDPLYTIENDCVSVTVDGNLGKTGMTYYISDNSSFAVGGWHIEVPADADAFALFDLCKDIAGDYGYNVFYAYINGETRIRAGQFGSRAAAEAACGIFAQAGLSAAAAGPTETAVSVVDPYTDTILYEFDCGTDASLGLEPLQTGGSIAYLVTPAKNTYAGIFKYARYRTGIIDGVALTNILPLEEYVKGVLPWEIGNTWQDEVMKTFAIAIRSFGLTSRKHITFDVCNTPCCQVYKGRNKVNEAVEKAVAETAGTVLSYDNRIVCTYYSSSTGGTTVSASDAWGYSEKYPYLRAVVTPWEQYKSYPNAVWTTEYTPAQLQAKLNSTGYTSLTGGIKSVEIQSFAENSSYVKSLLITDTKGNTVTINRSDAIRTALDLNSANFVVAKAGSTVTVTDYSLEGDGIATLFENRESQNKGSVYVLSGNNSTAVPLTSEVVALTSETGLDTDYPVRELSVISENGTEKLNLTPAPDSSLPDLSATNVIKTQRTVTAEGTPGNFVFIGRGWGHGVGLSQYGAKDLAALGYDCQTILTTYFPGTVLTDYRSILNVIK